MQTAIWWIRRDLRLADNQALPAALRQAEQVVPVFVLDPAILDRPTTGQARLAFLFDGLRRLDADLRARGSALLLRRGDPLAELTRLRDECAAQAILAEQDFSPYSRQRDERVAQALPLQHVGGRLVHPPGSVRKADGAPYVVFTPFSRAWRALPPPATDALSPAPPRIPTLAGLTSLPIPDQPARPPDAPFPAGEDEAQRRLRAFVAQLPVPVFDYAKGRDRVDLDATSRLSPYLHLGMLSSRQVVAAAHDARQRAPHDDARQGADTWLNELIWREFYTHILAFFPHVLERDFRPTPVQWENDPAAFDAWCTGHTGYPLVDAAMRQLLHTGWMHNRARMVVASFLVKDLLIDWRWGERFFLQQLVDGDTAANNGGWQWSAGTGTDAAPYFRIMNPVLQGQKYDPQGDYVRRWLPELAGVPERWIHQPWRMPTALQQSCGCEIGRDYPAPIVDHAWARERALGAYRRERNTAGTKTSARRGKRFVERGPNGVAVKISSSASERRVTVGLAGVSDGRGCGAVGSLRRRGVRRSCC